MGRLGWNVVKDDNESESGSELTCLPIIMSPCNIIINVDFVWDMKASRGGRRMRKSSLLNGAKAFYSPFLIPLNPNGTLAITQVRLWRWRMKSCIMRLNELCDIDI